MEIHVEYYISNIDTRGTMERYEGSSELDSLEVMAGSKYHNDTYELVNL